MERLVLVSLSILTFTGKSFGDEHVHVKYQEDEDVTLPCTFSTSLTDSRIDWKQDGKNGRKDVFLWEYGTVQLSSQDEHFKDRVSHFPDKIKHGNASIIIKNAKVSDSGTYTCLYVNRGETDPEEYHKVILTVGTCPKPTISPLKEIDGGIEVECEALGASPLPIVELQNSANVTVNIKPPEISTKGNYFDVILLTVVKKKDYYHCVVKQEDICHQINSKQILVSVPSGETVNPRNTGLKIGLGVGAGVVGFVFSLFF